ncbi:MAG TPA: FAD-dependent oxidoreductase [Streptosporangiaceae bacterium]|nr:FAD-dependent oxidoreductase [Streptosporangiaceae bacterium]
MSAPRTARAAHRVVIVGAGMAGARLAEEIVQRDPDGRVHVTMLGAEPHRPYNRVQLTNVLAGSMAEDDIPLPVPDEDAVVRLGVAVRAIDRDRRQVITDDGDAVGYDTLVLATGADPLIPPVRGVRTADGGLRPGVFVFRTLDDCRALAAAAEAARRVVVVGGGVLGLEAARGLAGRGLDVCVLHMAPWLMETRLDAEGGKILRAAYRDVGIDVRVDATATEVSGVDRADGVVLDSGERIPADLVVFSCGMRPSTRLAADSGLRVERGIVVDDELRTSDPRIFALGDCAQHPGVAGGLLDSAWEQATVLAELITDPGSTTRYTGSAEVTRLKAADVDLVAMGEVNPDDEQAASVVFSDARRRTYKKLVLRDERLVGAVLLGDDETSGLVTQLFDRGAVAPPDPKVLLFRGLRQGADDSGPDLPDEATVCRCNGVTRGEIVREYTAGARTLDALADRLRSGTGCGSCRGQVAALIADLPADMPAA